jgi:predicted ribosomally synthesized peptide with nif11-like leader
MTQQNAARLYKEVKQAEANQQKQKAINEPERFIELASAKGYSFSKEDLEAQLQQLSAEEIARIWNPGIPPRQHLIPR